MRRVTIAAVAVLTLSACRGGAPAADRAQPPPVADAAASRLVVVALGDSLTAGLGLAADEAYPARLEARLQADGLDVTVENAGVSGDTTAGGLRRLQWALSANARVLIVALGGNDALRGLAPADTYSNLAAILDAARARRLRVLLAGMDAPPNLGRDYQVAFHGVFTRLAVAHPEVAFVPFLLEGVAGRPALNQADGIHPNARGAQMIADLLYPTLRPLVEGALAEARGPGAARGRFPRPEN